MKATSLLFAAAVSALSVMLYAHTAYSAGFKVESFVVCSSVQDREPVGISDTFNASDERVYVYLEATDIDVPSKVEVVWSYEGAEQRRTSLNIGLSDRWRTYAYKNLHDMAGKWRVDLVDTDGNVISTAEFTVK